MSRGSSKALVSPDENSAADGTGIARPALSALSVTSKDITMSALLPPAGWPRLDLGHESTTTYPSRHAVRIPAQRRDANVGYRGIQAPKNQKPHALKSGLKIGVTHPPSQLNPDPRPKEAHRGRTGSPPEVRTGASARPPPHQLRRSAIDPDSMAIAEAQVMRVNSMATVPFGSVGGSGCPDWPHAMQRSHV